MFKKKERNDGEYDKRSDRLNAWSNLIRSFSKLLWIFVIFIIIAGLGKLFIFKSGKNVPSRTIIEKPVLKRIPWESVNLEIKEVLQKSRKIAEGSADQKLDNWIAGLMERVDKDFLEWYFSYWTQQKIGIKGLLAQIWHWVDGDSPTAAEKITEEVQLQFANRVLRPQIAQMELERIINEIMIEYSRFLSGELEGIPEKYNIKKADWDRYLHDVAVLIRSVEGNREISLSLKALVAAGAGGALLMFSSLRPVLSKIGSGISAKLTSKAAAKMATKTGGKVAVRAGGKFVGTVIAVGIIIWDVWDHYNTKKKARPVLKENINDYFLELKRSILRDPEYGIMTVIFRMEGNIVETLKSE